MPEERIQKIIAAAGIASRRAAEELIAAGRVTVDGRVVALGDRADAERADVRVDGRRVGGPEAARHLVLNKPVGVTSTVRDRHAGRAVVDLVPPGLARGARLYPVGRLDADSEGLVLLTNDGDWAQRVLHPRHAIEREYAVGVDRPLAPAAIEALVAGIELEEGTARVVAVRGATTTETRRLLESLDGTTRAYRPLTWYRVTLAQGWKRQVRRMFGAVGEPVRRLVRVRFGAIRLGDLAPGACRELTPAEVASVAGSAGTARDVGAVAGGAGDGPPGAGGRGDGREPSRALGATAPRTATRPDAPRYAHGADRRPPGRAGGGR